MISVVIVDDNKPMADRIQKSVPWESLGCSVVSVQHDGIAGKKAITQLRPDLVITDIRMPGLNGLEMMDMIREFLPDCKVIFISFYEYFDYAYKAMKLHAQDFLIKPFEQAELLRVIQNVVSEIAARKDSADGPPSHEIENLSPKAQRIIAYLNDHASENLHLQELAFRFGLSASHLGRLIKQETGKRFTELMIAQRMLNAKSLLRKTDYRIEDIAEMVGYKSYLIFYQVFIKQVGVSPSVYRKGGAD